jgi:hypothetical protein
MASIDLSNLTKSSIHDRARIKVFVRDDAMNAAALIRCQCEIYRHTQRLQPHRPKDSFTYLKFLYLFVLCAGRTN